MNHKCFALIEGTQCNAITIEKCLGSTCSFYKTVQQHDQSCKKANARLASLSKERQKYIATKYFMGQMPWQEGR